MQSWSESIVKELLRKSATHGHDISFARTGFVRLPVIDKSAKKAPRFLHGMPDRTSGSAFFLTGCQTERKPPRHYAEALF